MRKLRKVPKDKKTGIAKKYLSGSRNPAAKAAEIPIILLKYGYTEKHSNEIYHNHLIKDFVGIEKIITEYL